MGPEFELWILDEFNKGDQQAPGVGTVHYKSFKEYPGKKYIVLI